MISIDGIINIPPEENLNHPSRNLMGVGRGISNYPNPFIGGPLIDNPIDTARRIKDNYQDMFNNKSQLLKVVLEHVLKNEYVKCTIVYKSHETLVLSIYGKEVVFTVGQFGDSTISIGNSTEPHPASAITLKHILEDKDKDYQFRMELLTGRLLVDIVGLGLGCNK